MLIHALYELPVIIPITDHTTVSTLNYFFSLLVTRRIDSVVLNKTSGTYNRMLQYNSQTEFFYKHIIYLRKPRNSDYNILKILLDRENSNGIANKFIYCPFSLKSNQQCKSHNSRKKNVTHFKILYFKYYYI